MVRRSREAVGPIRSVPDTLSDVKERHGLSYGFEKSRGILPGTIDRMSKYVTASGPEWGKGDCGPFESTAVIVNTTSACMNL